MAKSTLRRHTAWLSAALLLAGCQAGAPTAPVAPEPPADLSAFKQAHGLPAWMAKPPVTAPAAAPGFRVAASTGLVGTEITLSTAAGDQEFVDVAYNATTKQYLAVWHDLRSGTSADIYGQLLSADGVATGAPVAIYSGAGMQVGPRVIYNSVDKEYMVAWTDNRSNQTDVYVQRVSGAGALVNAPKAVASGTSAQTLSGIGYHAARNEYMLAWTDDRLGFSALYAGRASAAGDKLGGDISVSLTPGALGGGGIAVNPTSGDYVIAWADARAGAPGIYTRRVSSTGALSGNAVAVATGAAEFFAPHLAYNASASGFMAVYDRRNPTTGDSDVFAQRLDGTGAVLGAAMNVTTAAGQQMLPAVATNTDDGSYLVTWADGRANADELDLYTKAYKADGTVKDAEFSVCTVPGLQAMSAIAFDGTKKHFLVAWSDSRNHAAQGFDLFAQRVRGGPMTAQEAIDELIGNTTEILDDAGVTSNGPLAKLENALDKIAQGNVSVAIIQLTIFIGQITLLQVTGQISAQDATLMITLANQAILQLQTGNP